MVSQLPISLGRNLDVSCGSHGLIAFLGIREIAQSVVWLKPIS